MKRRRSLVIPLALGFLILVLGVSLILPLFARAKVRGGPGIKSRLLGIESFKQVFGSELTNEWPTIKDLGMDSWGYRRYGELYIINRTGETPIAYFPKDSEQYRAGELWWLQSNQPVRFEGQLDRRAWKASGITNIPKLRR